MKPIQMAVKAWNTLVMGFFTVVVTLLVLAALAQLSACAQQRPCGEPGDCVGAIGVVTDAGYCRCPS